MTTAWDDEQDEAAESDFQPLTREEAQALVAAQPSISPWKVVAAQALAGVLVALLAALIGHLTGHAGAGASALYGAACVVLPTAVMAWGLARRTPGGAVGGAALGFMAWQFAKMAMAVVLLVLAPWLMKTISWPALLVAMVLCLKVNWLALLKQGRARKND